jgi:hypothetical protein
MLVLKPVLLTVLLLLGVALAREYVVQATSGNVFDPSSITITADDTVRFEGVENGHTATQVCCVCVCVCV